MDTERLIYEAAYLWSYYDHFCASDIAVDPAYDGDFLRMIKRKINNLRRPTHTIPVYLQIFQKDTHQILPLVLRKIQPSGKAFLLLLLENPQKSHPGYSFRR